MRTTRPFEPIPEFGKHLRSLRKQRGLSQRALADLAGIHYTHIANMERGRAEGVSEQTLSGIATALDTDPAPLLNLAGKVPKTLKAACEDNPLLTELVRILGSRVFPDDVYRRLLAMAREGIEP